jgi:galactose oxidase
MNWFTTTGEGGARDAGTRPGADAMCGNAVMYDAGKIITFGGAPAYSESDATKSSILITLTGTAVATKPVGALNVARGFANGVVLPDGKVLAVGGQARPIPFSDENSALESGVSPQLKKIDSWNVVALNSAKLSGCNSGVAARPCMWGDKCVYS